MSEPVRLVRPSDRAPADPSPGVQREEAFAVPGLWSGLARTEPGAVSGWHHHGDHDTSIYVVSGRLRLEVDQGGPPLDAGPGDFLHVPPRVVHREGNPGSEVSVVVLSRAGTGVPTVNVADPPGR